MFMAIVHRKRHSLRGYVSRYERVVVIWEGRPPFRTLALSRRKILFQGEAWGVLGRKEKSSKGSGLFRETHKTSLNSSTTNSSTTLIREAPATRTSEVFSNLDHPPAFDSNMLEKRDIEPNSMASTARPQPGFIFPLSIAFDHSRRGNEGGDEFKIFNPKEMYIGYLDDYLIMGVGIKDKGMGVVRLKVSELLQDIVSCPAAL